MQQIINAVREYFEDQKRIGAVYLFGSAAKNLLRSNSDIDIAILIDRQISDKMERFDLIFITGLELEQQTGRPFDVIDIAMAPPKLQHQILKTGQLLVENDRLARINFEVASRRNYFDLLPLYQARDENILRQLQGE